MEMEMEMGTAGNRPEPAAITWKYHPRKQQTSQVPRITLMQARLQTLRKSHRSYALWRMVHLRDFLFPMQMQEQMQCML